MSRVVPACDGREVDVGTAVVDDRRGVYVEIWGSCDRSGRPAVRLYLSRAQARDLIDAVICKLIKEDDDA